MMVAAGSTEHGESILAVIQGGQRSFVRVKADRALEVLARPVADLGVQPMTGTILPYVVNGDSQTTTWHFLDTATGVDRVWRRTPRGNYGRVACARDRPICVLREGRYVTRWVDPRTGELGAPIGIDLGVLNSSATMIALSFDGSELALMNDDATGVEVIHLPDGHVSSFTPSSPLTLMRIGGLAFTAAGDVVVTSEHDKGSTLVKLSRDGRVQPLVAAPDQALLLPMVSLHGEVAFTAQESHQTISFLPFETAARGE
jgi:hypothetical protein